MIIYRMPLIMCQSELTRKVVKIEHQISFFILIGCIKCSFVLSVNFRFQYWVGGFSKI